VEIWRRLSQFLGSVRQQVLDKLGPLGKSLGLGVSQTVPPVLGTPMRGSSSTVTSPVRNIGVTSPVRGSVVTSPARMKIE